MKKTVIVDAPGKINLSFDITGVREDGYHEVNTVYQTIDLYDTVTVSRMSGDGVFISCDRPRIPCDETNLAHIAARRFFEAYSVPKTAISIDLQKRIPQQAGLAGGSADAAGVLVGLNVLLDVHADIESLCKVGAEIGADVPFCIVGGTKQASGIGEVLSPLPPLPKCFITLAQPSAGISTPESFQKYDKIDAVTHPDVETLIKYLYAGDLKGVGTHLGNVLETVAELPEIPALKQRMADSGALGTLMSGSGSAVFGLFDSKRLAKRCIHRLYDLASGIYLAHPINHGAIVTDSRE